MNRFGEGGDQRVRERGGQPGGSTDARPDRRRIVSKSLAAELPQRGQRVLRYSGARGGLASTLGKISQSAKAGLYGRAWPLTP